MALLALLVCHILLLLLSCHVVEIASNKDEQPVIAAYLPDYRIQAVDLNASAPFLTDLMLYSIQPHARGFVSGCCLDQAHYEKARQAREYAKQLQPGSTLRLWITVGGGGRSEAIPEVAADPKRRARLIQGLVRLCETQEIDGVDFDWESPRSQEEVQLYFLLLQEASEALHNANRLVSAALHTRQFLPSQVYEWMDRIHLMTYDFYGDRHHAAYDRVVEEVLAYTEDGRCPPDKLLMGIPAYARHTANSIQVRTFSELMEDSDGKAVSQNTWNGYRYDSPDDVRQKVQRAMTLGLAGVFFWELGQDKQHEDLGPGGILLEAAAAVAHHSLEGDTRQQDEL